MLSCVVCLALGLVSVQPADAFAFQPMTAQQSTSSFINRQNFYHNNYDLQKNRWTSNAILRKRAPTTSRLKGSQNSNKLSRSTSSASSRVAIRKDVLIIGGGLAGLSIALSLAQSGREVTLLEKNDQNTQYSKSNVAGSFAAAGMLAPQSERLPMGPLLDLCLQSREIYVDFVQNVESLARNAGQEGKAYLYRDGHPEAKVIDKNGENSMEPWEVGFQATGGFLAPAFAGDSVATWAPPPGGGVAYWLDEIQVRELEPQLHPDVIGGWWFPEDASVDARRLTCSLRAACVTAGVHISMGSDVAAASLELSGGKCNGVHLVDGRIFTADSIIVANGSWMRELLPVPITPHKGQSFSLRMPSNTPPILSRVLFAQDTYIVPKSDGRIVVGATVEPGSFDPNVTPAGMMHCMKNAIALVPALGDLPLEETWSGLRPTTPDKGPILGKTAWENLYVAGGYWRNGVLLAPKTAQLIADLVNECLSEDDQTLLNEFSWDRFTSPEGGAKIAAASRYAASMHPVHNRASGVGISASVGTELGFYSGAGSAKSERMRDRQALFGGSESDESMDDAFEKAASMGRKDILAFSNGNKNRKFSSVSEGTKSSSLGDKLDIEEEVRKVSSFEGIADAFTIGTTEEENKNDLLSAYETIKENKVKASAKVEMGEKENDTRPDPGFRIFHVDEETGEKRLVPPYTSEGAMKKILLEEKAGTAETSSNSAGVEEKSEVKEEPIYDGYTMITEANASGNRSDELNAMRAARMKNRGITSEIDESLIGARKRDDTNADSLTNEHEAEEKMSSQSKLKSVYEQIKTNKAKNSADLQMGDKKDSDRPELPFRIYHVDNETGEQRLVPPYTTQAAMEEMINQEKKSKSSGATEKHIPETKVDNIESGESEGYDGFDGYTDIKSANSNQSRDEELAAMRKARMSNRVNFGTAIDEDQIPKN